MQRLSIEDRAGGVTLRSWPSAGVPAFIRLATSATVTLPDATTQHPHGGQLAGCHLEMKAWQLSIFDQQVIIEEQHAHQDVARCLLDWMRRSHAATLAIEPAPKHPGAVSVAIWHGDHFVGHAHYCVMTTRLLSMLQRHCGSHGLSCGFDAAAYSVLITRID